MLLHRAVSERLGLFAGEAHEAGEAGELGDVRERVDLPQHAGGVAQINVGAATEVAMKEKKARVEDALHACRAAVEEGILPGGGVAVIRAAARVLDKLRKGESDDIQVGIDIVRRAIEAPIKQ